MTDDETPKTLGEAARAQPSTSSNVLPLRRPPSAAIKRIIGELGLRYRPSAQADLEEHAACLALLARDVADIPPDILRRAVDRHVAISPYMPKACELIEASKALLRGPIEGEIDWVTIGNRTLNEIGRHDIRWSRDEGGALVLGPAA